MAGMYLGTLDHHDPLYEVLALRAYPKTRYPVFHVHRMSGHHLVYCYSEQTTKSSVVGKFFRVNGANEHTLERIKGEYRNLVRLRELGLAAPPYSVVKPLCREEKIGLAVAEEFVEGRDLDEFLRRAVDHGATRALTHVLWRLASFLHTLHERSAGASIARHEDVGSYFQRIVGKLQRQGVIDRSQGTWFLRQRDRWLGATFMMAEEVIVHGDATPTNFIFRGSDDVVAIDLERMRRSDRVFDVGMVVRRVEARLPLEGGRPVRLGALYHGVPQGVRAALPAPRRGVLGNHPTGPLLHGAHRVTDRAQQLVAVGLSETPDVGGW